jgi:hypothetical protein
MTIQGYARWKRGIFGLACAIAASMVLLQPLHGHFKELRLKSMALSLIKTLPVTHPHIFESTLRLDTLRIRHEDDVLHIHAKGTVLHDKVENLQENVDLFRDVLEEKAGMPVVAEIEAIPIEIVRVRAAPDGGKDQGAPSTTIGE